MAKKSSSNPIVTPVRSREVLFRGEDRLRRLISSGVFIARSKDDDMLLTKNMVVGESVYGEKRISVDVRRRANANESILVFLVQAENQEKIEYRVWNPFRSKLGAAILSGVDSIHMPPGTKVLYLGAASGTTVSHVSDIVGPVSDATNVR